MAPTPRRCSTCKGVKGKYETETRKAPKGKTVDSKTWKACTTCDGRGAV